MELITQQANDNTFDILTRKITMEELFESNNDNIPLLVQTVEISNLEQTFGFRPYADKNEPYVSLDPNNKKIIYNFGHYRYGILTAIPSAQIVKRLVS